MKEFTNSFTRKIYIEIKYSSLLHINLVGYAQILK